MFFSLFTTLFPLKAKKGVSIQHCCLKWGVIQKFFLRFIHWWQYINIIFNVHCCYICCCSERRLYAPFQNHSVFSMFLDVNSRLDIRTDFERNIFLGRKNSCITLKQNTEQAPKAINQRSIYTFIVRAIKKNTLLFERLLE